MKRSITLPMKELSIVFCCDNNYVQHMGVAITSILKNNRNNQIHFYILNDGISLKNQKKIIRLKKIKNCHIDFITISAGDFQNCKVPENTRFTRAIYYRFKILSLVPVKDVVLYLDCDLVCLKDLAPLFKTDFKGNWLAACEDFLSKELANKRHLTHPYFNSGMLLFNVPLCRKNNLEKKLFTGVSTITNVELGDQDIMNEIAGKHILPLNSVYNSQYQPQLGKSEKILLKKLKQIVILHYVTAHKPWKESHSKRLNNIYLKYLLLSPWKWNAIPLCLKRVRHFCYSYQKHDGIKQWRLFTFTLFQKYHDRNSKRYFFKILGIPFEWRRSR